MYRYYDVKLSKFICENISKSLDKYLIFLYVIFCLTLKPMIQLAQEDLYSGKSFNTFNKQNQELLYEYTKQTLGNLFENISKQGQ